MCTFTRNPLFNPDTKTGFFKAYFHTKEAGYVVFPVHAVQRLHERINGGTIQQKLVKAIDTIALAKDTVDGMLLGDRIIVHNNITYDCYAIEKKKTHIVVLTAFNEDSDFIHNTFTKEVYVGE